MYENQKETSRNYLDALIVSGGWNAKYGKQQGVEKGIRKFKYHHHHRHNLFVARNAAKL